jgi:hypothetical protein
MSYAFIGDVHSQSEPLSKSLGYCEKHGLRPILLGDLFDTHCQTSDSAGVYHLVRKAEKILDAVILQSNHQKLLINLAEGDKVPIRKCLSRTVMDFVKSDICVKDVAKWLKSLPYAVRVRDNGIEYRMAHAEIPETVKFPHEPDFWTFHDPTPEEERLLLWGKSYSLPDSKRFWWRNNKKKRDWVQVCGHYHKVVNTNRTIVLDAGCGGKSRAWYDDRPPELLLFDTSKRCIVRIPALS